MPTFSEGRFQIKGKGKLSKHIRAVQRRWYIRWLVSGKRVGHLSTFWNLRRVPQKGCQSQTNDIRISENEAQALVIFGGPRWLVSVVRVENHWETSKAPCPLQHGTGCILRSVQTWHPKVKGKGPWHTLSTWAMSSRRKANELEY